MAPLPTGSQQANSAGKRMVIVRIPVDPRTREYVARYAPEGLDKKEVTRHLKRYVAREAYRGLPTAATGPPHTPWSTRHRRAHGTMGA